jgi:glycosyltransferase involved in cell wall biosynthesis
MTTSTPFEYGWKTLAQPYNYSYLAPLVCALGKGLGARKVLDVGAGNGYALPTWLKQGWEVCAMEPDVEGYTIAKTVEEVDVRQLGVGEELPADWSKAFDMVICTEVVVHLFDPHQLVQTAFDALQEGFGWPIVEAMACGCPVVTTGRAPMTEGGGEAAIYIDPSDIKGSASAISELLDWSEPERVVQVERGFTNVRQFTRSSLAEHYALAYEDALQSKESFPP